MAAQAGRLMLLKVDTNGSGSFSTIGGMREKSLTQSAEEVDITTADSTNQERELGATMGVKSKSFTGGGIFTDDAQHVTCQTYFDANTIREWQVIIPGFGTYEGLFQISAYNFTGPYNGAVSFELTLSSAGTITFTGA